MLRNHYNNKFQGIFFFTHVPFHIFNCFISEKHNMEFEVLKKKNTTETLTYTIAGMILGLLVVKCLEIRF